MIFRKFKQQYDEEITNLNFIDDYGLDGCQKSWIDRVFGSLAPKILNKDGSINWWWVAWNIGKIVAKVVFAIRISKR